MPKRPDRVQMKRQMEERPDENPHASMLRERLKTILSDALGDPDLPVTLEFGKQKLAIRIERDIEVATLVANVRQLTQSVSAIHRAISIARSIKGSERLDEHSMDHAQAGVELISNLAAEFAKAVPDE